mmetsp:Transcript_65518/g.145577  ORF Transcript_65518/g.145577 Transcript_65518/m.145577 type:complete len:286 (+) Transcript_65518:466-1323(+)
MTKDSGFASSDIGTSSLDLPSKTHGPFKWVRRVNLLPSSKSKASGSLDTALLSERSFNSSCGRNCFLDPSRSLTSTPFGKLWHRRPVTVALKSFLTRTLSPTANSSGDFASSSGSASFRMASSLSDSKASPFSEASSSDSSSSEEASDASSSPRTLKTPMDMFQMLMPSGFSFCVLMSSYVHSGLGKFEIPGCTTAFHPHSRRRPASASRSPVFFSVTIRSVSSPCFASLCKAAPQQSAGSPKGNTCRVGEYAMRKAGGEVPDANSSSMNSDTSHRWKTAVAVRS